MKAIIVLALSILVFSNASLAAQPEFRAPSTNIKDIKKGFYKLDEKHAKLLFGVSHLGFSNFYSEFKSFDANLYVDPENLEKSYVKVEIDSESADSGNKILNGKYMGSDFFDVKKHPKITFKSNEIEVLEGNKGKLYGDLTMLGKTKQITLDVTFNGTGFNKYSGGNVLGFSAKGVITRSQFGMNSYIPAVSDEVFIIIESEFNLDDKTKYPKKTK